MVTLKNVIKLFENTRAVDGISFDVKEGENAVLLGTSGCGKTTTLRMVNRLIEPTSGTIQVAGKNIHDILPEELRRNIGYVSQYNGLFPHYTIAENIGIVPQLLKWPKAKIAARTAELMEQFHLPENLLSLYPRQLSGGQQQRVGLARALAADPPVLLMDEPFGSLDTITRENITKEFLKLEALKNKTIILVTHDIGEAFKLGDKILLMTKGKIVKSGTPADILFNPGNEFADQFFSAQRMQLELHTVLMRDIWPYLLSEHGEGNHVSEIEETNSVWDALSALSLNGHGRLLIKNANEEKYAGYASLFNALDALKRKDHE